MQKTLKRKIEELAETKALEMYLSDMPCKKTYNEVLSDIREQSDEITVWEPFDDHSPDALIELIESERSCQIQSAKEYRAL